MPTIIENLRNIIGIPNFLTEAGAWDYGAIIEYFCAVVLLCICVTSVFRFLSRLVSK